MTLDKFLQFLGNFSRLIIAHDHYSNCSAVTKIVYERNGKNGNLYYTLDIIPIAQFLDYCPMRKSF